MTLASAPIRGERLNTRLEWQGAEFLVPLLIS